MKLRAFLFVTSILFLCSCEQGKSEPGQSHGVSEVKVEVSPRQVVEQFWAHSIRGEKEAASALITSGTVADINWRPEATSTPKTVDRPRSAGAGTGGANPQFRDERFAEMLKGRIGLIREKDMKLQKIFRETIVGERAEVVVETLAPGLKGTYKQRVILVKSNGDWRLVAIWDDVKEPNQPLA